MAGVPLLESRSAFFYCQCKGFVPQLLGIYQVSHVCMHMLAVWDLHLWGIKEYDFFFLYKMPLFIGFG